MGAKSIDAEIRRINKMHLSAGQRSDRVRRLQSVAACLSEPAAPPLDDVWCSRCGYLLETHDQVERILGKG